MKLSDPAEYVKKLTAVLEVTKAYRGIIHLDILLSTIVETAAEKRALESGTELVGALMEGSFDAELPVMVYRLPDAENRAPETLRPMVRDILGRFELEGLRARNQLLESLSDVGVALAGSFDIQAILRKTQGAAEQLAKVRTVEVLYKGCDAIHSRALWHPDQPGPGHMGRDERRAMLARVSRGHDEVPTAFEHGSRLFLPIAYQAELLGLLVLRTGDGFGPEGQKLLSILTLQTATALRNIHLTQERIQFERLSAVGRMIGSIVHDFRSPLTALRGYAGMLTNLELSKRERSAYGHSVVEECDRLNHMVDELLEFTRGGHFDLSLEWFRPAPYLGALAARLHTQFAERHIRVELELGYSGEIFVDKKRLDRALWNVAINACQAMSDGGELILRSESFGNRVCLSVEDDGSGIPEEVQHRIFEPFFSYGKSEGIGLGMLIAQKFVEDHGGQITVESEEGVGTQVRFYLPVDGSGQPTAVAEHELASKSKSPESPLR